MPFYGQAAFAAERSFMEFFNSAIGVLQTLVIALGAGLGIWGVINLLEGCSIAISVLVILLLHKTKQKVIKDNEKFLKLT